MLPQHACPLARNRRRCHDVAVWWPPCVARELVVRFSLFRRRCDVRYRTDGISGAAQQGFTDWEEAWKYFREAHARGETRVVHRAPKPEPGERVHPSDVVDMPKIKEPRGRLNPQKHYQKQYPQQSAQSEKNSGTERGSFVGSGGGRGSASGIAKRNAQIAAGMEEGKRDLQRNASARERRTVTPQRTASDGVPYTARAITAPPGLASASSWHPALDSASAIIPASRQRQRGSSAPRAAPGREPEPPKTSTTFSTSSSPPTAITQTKNVFSIDGESRSSRYAQSLSYASSPGNSPEGLRSPPLSLSDWRSHLSEPSSLQTQYFPANWPERQQQDQRRRRGSQATARNQEMSTSQARRLPAVFQDRPPSPEMSDSEYATAPNTPENQTVDLPHEFSLRRDRRLSAEAMPPPPLPPSRAEKTRPTMTEPERTVRPAKTTINTVGRSLSETQVRGEREPESRRRKQDNTMAQSTSPLKKRYTDGQVQTKRIASPPQSPLRGTASEGNVFAHSPASTSKSICMCDRPQYVCRCCGGEQRIQSASASHSPALSTGSSAVPPSDSAKSYASPVSVASKSVKTPVPSTPSSPSSEHRSMQSPVGGHTPLMGTSERQVGMRPITNSIHATMEAMNFSETARGAEPVVHDMRFDPRSPIQRGTTIPAG